MCPFCVSTLGLIIAGTVSTGGLAALAMAFSRKKDDINRVFTDPHERSDSDVKHYEYKTE